MQFFLACLQFDVTGTFPAGKYMFKINNRSTRTRCEICSKVNNKDSRTTPMASDCRLYSSEAQLKKSRNYLRWRAFQRNLSVFVNYCKTLHHRGLLKSQISLTSLFLLMFQKLVQELAVLLYSDLTLLWCLFLLTLNSFHTLSVSIVEFEQVNAGRDKKI